MKKFTADPAVVNLARSYVSIAAIRHAEWIVAVEKAQPRDSGEHRLAEHVCRLGALAAALCRLRHECFLMRKLMEAPLVTEDTWRMIEEARSEKDSRADGGQDGEDGTRSRADVSHCPDGCGNQ